MYSVTETAIKLEVSTRAVQKRCKRDNVRKKDNKYLITDEHIEKWLLEIKSNEPQTNQTNEPFLEVRRIKDIEGFNIDAIEDFEFEFKRDGEFPKKGNLEFVPKGKYIIQYSPAEYEQLKKEYTQAEDEIKLGRFKEETFKKLQTSLEEKIEFITEQMQYYMKLADKTLDMQSSALETLSTQTKDHFIQTTISAKKTDWKKK